MTMGDGRYFKICLVLSMESMRRRGKRLSFCLFLSIIFNSTKKKTNQVWRQTLLSFVWTGYCLLHASSHINSSLPSNTGFPLPLTIGATIQQVLCCVSDITSVTSTVVTSSYRLPTLLLLLFVFCNNGSFCCNRVCCFISRSFFKSNHPLIIFV